MQKLFQMVSSVLAPFTNQKEMSAEEHINQGYQEMIGGKHEKAIKHFTQALEISPTSNDAYYNRGSTYAAMGERVLAIKDYTKALEINSNDVDAYYNRGTSYDALGDYNNAMQDYSKAIELSPTSHDAYYNRGCLHVTLKMYQPAVEDFNKVLELEPNFSMAYNNRGFCFKTLERYAEALSDYSKAIELDASLRIAYINRCVVYTKIHQLYFAYLDAQKACELGDCGMVESLKKNKTKEQIYNVNFNDLSPELIAQIIIGSAHGISHDETLFPKSFYNTLVASATVARLIHHLPLGSVLKDALGFSQYTLQGLFAFLKDQIEGDNKEIILEHLGETIQKGELTPIIETYANQNFIDNLDYLSDLVQNNKKECELTIDTIDFIKDNIESVLKSFKTQLKV